LRTEELRTSSGGEAERQAIADALSSLAILMNQHITTNQS